MALNAQLPNFFMQWTDDAALTLIRRRRAFQYHFSVTAINSQKRFWRRISRDVRAAHPNFVVNRQQCRTKWNSLKTGYENLKRLLNGNPEGFPTRTPSLHDERFHDELSDEFWLAERNYLLFNFN